MTLLVWAALAASVVAWGLKLLAAPAPVPREARVADAGSAMRGDVTRVLGVDAAPSAPAAAASMPAAPARFQLIGVVAPRSARPVREGVALIAVDGKPAKAYVVGAKVDDGTVLKGVRARGADLGPREGAATIALEVAPAAPAASGALPSAAVPAAPAVVVPAGTPPPPSRRARGLVGAGAVPANVPAPAPAPTTESNAAPLR